MITIQSNDPGRQNKGGRRRPEHQTPLPQTILHQQTLHENLGDLHLSDSVEVLKKRMPFEQGLYYAASRDQDRNPREQQGSSPVARPQRIPQDDDWHHDEAFVAQEYGKSETEAGQLTAGRAARTESFLRLADAKNDEEQIGDLNPVRRCEPYIDRKSTRLNSSHVSISYA